jgi:hypothetical protein
MNNTFAVYKNQLSRAWKENKEYPANLWAGFFTHITLIISELFFYFILLDLSTEIITWNYYDFVVFILYL